MVIYGYCDWFLREFDLIINIGCCLLCKTNWVLWWMTHGEPACGSNGSDWKLLVLDLYINSRMLFLEKKVLTWVDVFKLFLENQLYKK